MVEFGTQESSIPTVVFVGQQGSVVIRHLPKAEEAQHQPDTSPAGRTIVLHTDIIKDAFWQQHPEILASKRLK